MSHHNLCPNDKAFNERLAVLKEMRDYITVEVAAGFLSEKEIREGAVELFGEDQNPAWLKRNAKELTRAALELHLAEQATWPAETDCDRLNHAFAVLEVLGIITRHNFMCCTTCGRAQLQHEMQEMHRKDSYVRGYAFYHAQSTESALAGRGLNISFGSLVKGHEAALAIAREVVGGLEGQKLVVDWDGEADGGIHVQMNWKMRRNADGSPMCRSGYDESIQTAVQSMRRLLRQLPHAA